MERRRRIKAVWIMTGVALLATAVVVPLLVFASSGQTTLTAESYADVIRFEVRDAASLQITVYDLSEKEIWNSGVVPGDWVDWDRTDTWGDRLANGYYLYRAQAWDINDNLILSKTGKVALLPGDQVQLQRAPSASAPSSGTSLETSPTTEPALQPQPRSYQTTGNITAMDSGSGRYISLVPGPMNQQIISSAGNINLTPASGIVRMTKAGKNFAFQLDTSAQAAAIYLSAAGTSYLNGGNVGVGTADAPARITVQGTTGDLIAAYNSSSRAAGAAVFVVKSTGEVRADGAVYAASFNTGSADVAERINTSEWVEAGDVVEIDPEHPGFFRKSSDAYSRKVAGIISTSPGVILGNSSDPETDDWNDNRPVLAVTGRVPVKATTENGAIQVGDLLVASSTPGVAMRGEPGAAIGCVVGKAMEALAEGDGVIMAQVMLR